MGAAKQWLVCRCVSYSLVVFLPCNLLNHTGSYSRTILLHAFVPFFAVVIFIVLALLPNLAWPIASFPSRYPKSFPSPLPEIFLSSAFFSLAHLLRVPFYSATCFLLSPESASVVSTLLHVLLTNDLRLVVLEILQVRHTMDYPTPNCQDPAFRTVWWLSLNFAEVIVAIAQGYEQLTLYRDVMVPEGREGEFLELLKAGSSTHLADGDGYPPEDASEDALEGGEGARNVDNQIDRDLEKLLVIKSREELEEVYGMPVIVRAFTFSFGMSLTSYGLVENPRLHIMPPALQLHHPIRGPQSSPLLGISPLATVAT